MKGQHKLHLEYNLTTLFLMAQFACSVHDNQHPSTQEVVLLSDEGSALRIEGMHLQVGILFQAAAFSPFCLDFELWTQGLVL